MRVRKDPSARVPSRGMPLPYWTLREWSAPTFTATQWAAAANRRLHYQASRAHDAWDLLPRITAPTLVLHDSRDELTPAANGERLAQLIPGAVLRILDGARHGYFLERPDATDAVLDFLAAHPL